jgi:hypothetical protein
MSVPSWAVRGAKVVCVDDDWTCDEIDTDLPDPVRGETYTIEGVDTDDDIDFEGGAGLYLAGFPDDAFYTIRNFRPLVTTKSEAEDLAHFRHHLTQKTPEVVE